MVKFPRIYEKLSQMKLRIGKKKEEWCSHPHTSYSFVTIHRKFVDAFDTFIIP